MRNAAGLAAGAALLFAATVNARASTISLGNVVPLGDSITEGKFGGNSPPGLTGGYRQYLQNDLSSLNYSYYFVGQEDNGQSANNTGYSAGMSDPNHEGYGSMTINEIISGYTLEGHTSPPIQTLLANDATAANMPSGDSNHNLPNVVLLMLGTNDALAGTNGSTTASYLNNLVSDIVTYDPTVTLFVSNVLPVDPNGSYTTSGTLTNIQQYDALIPSVIAPYNTTSHPVEFVDNYSTVNPITQTSDGVHPTYQGYAQMAQSWAHAIDSFNQVNPAYPDSVVNTSGSVTFPAGTAWHYGQSFVNSFNATPGGNINASTATFVSDSGSNFPNLFVSVDAGTVYFQSNQHLAALTIGWCASVQVTPTANGSHSLLQTWQYFVDNGTLDLTDNSLDVEGGSLATITGLIAQGYNGGYWNGAGIISSTAANDTTHLTALGVILNTSNSGSTLYGSNAPLGLFDGANPASSDVLVKYTYYGDSNLDGIVDGTDYARIDNGYLSHGTLTGWYNGDFNYDGVVNGSDYTLIDNTFNMQGAAINDAIANPSAGITARISVVPEPLGAASLTIASGAFALLRRRRKSTPL